MSSQLPVRGNTGIASPVPFGLGAQKPHHILEMLEVLWENRDSLPYAWSILNKGVCDGCSLGPRGLQDDVIAGTHLCTTRLKLLRLNTMPALAPVDVADIAHLRRMDNRQLQQLGRIPYPFVYRKGDRGFRRISWDEALKIAGDGLRATPAERQAWFATSRGITNEVYYAFTKAARLAGTNNVDLCARLCHQATVSGLKATIGVGAPTCSLKDLIGTDLLLLWGTDIANNQPVTMKYLAHAKAQGTRIVVINPVREKGLEAYWVPSMPGSALFGTTLMDDFVQVAVGGDIALLNGVLKALIERGGVDRAWVDAHTENWPAVEAHVVAMDWDDIVRDSGVERGRIEWLAELYARARTCVTIYSMGITQHTFGTENVEAIVNLHLSRGMLGREKTGILPIRGHSGVQGGGECGLAPGILPGGVPLTEENIRAFERHWQRPLPRHAGLTTMRMVEAMDQGGIDFLYNLGGNLFAVLPDPQWVADAYSKVKLRIHQDIVFNTSTVLEGADTVLVLPAQTRYEQRGGGTSTSTERRVRFSPEIPGHPTVGECRPEYEIPCQVVMAAFPDTASQLSYRDSSDLRREMAVTMPLYAGIETFTKAGDWIQWGGEQLCRDGRFPGMPGEKARFTMLEPRRVEVPEGAFYLTTRRGKQFNSIVIKDHDPVQGGKARNDVLISAVDLTKLGLSDGAPARLRSDTGAMDVTLREADIRAGVLQAYWPECNVLIGRRVDPRSEEPDYNTVVRVERR
jgi:molybdopterin-dependent oxidoreductase alpha subunit